MIDLHRGRDAAETIGSISERLNLPRRAVEQAIEDIRRAGIPVCSGSEGVWLAETAQEALEMAARLRSRYISQAITARAMRRSARAWALREAKAEALTLGFEEAA